MRQELPPNEKHPAKYPDIWPLAIVGLGVTGKSILNLLLATGMNPNQIATFDDKDPSAQFSNFEQLLSQFKPKALCVSPGYPLQTPWIQNFISQGGLLTSELEIANAFLTTEKIVAVTGSLGKSTTISLIEHALLKMQPRGFAGGNLGTPLAQYVLEKLQGRPAAAWIALELSSYQLENFKSLKAEHSAITYLTANHLERYQSKDDYYSTKWKLISQTTGSVVLNRNGGDLVNFENQHPCKTKHYVDRNSEILKKYSLLNPKLLGFHNLDNIAVAASLLELMGLSGELIESLADFRGLPHRVENLGEYQGITFVNDSKATTMDSVQTAVQSSLEKLNNTGNLHLLLGGKDKNLPWEDLTSFNVDSRIKPIFFGQVAETAKLKSKLQGPCFPTLRPAVLQAIQDAKAGDLVLLSPGGTSLDEFKNFESRGTFFCELVTAAYKA